MPETRTFIPLMYMRYSDWWHNLLLVHPRNLPQPVESEVVDDSRRINQFDGGDIY